VFVEVKTHREKWSGEKSKKERFEVPWNRMTDWLSGEWEPKKESSKVLASQTLATIKSMQLQPKIMTQYRRFVFQNPRTSFLRISMDSRLELAAFKGKDLFTANWTDREPVTWCQKFSADMICEFPLVVVELKTECKFCDAPQWMQSLADVTESPLRDTEGKFSKYGCGVALMFYNSVKDLVELPQPMRQVHWQNVLHRSLHLKSHFSSGLLPLRN
jgi:SPX domain protein involved in polyphosphate accumulation